MAFLQYICGRHSGHAQEVIFDSRGARLNQRLDPQFAIGAVEIPEDSFHRLSDVAARLSVGFSYVRVDLYLLEGSIYFGEMTFFPMAGWYRGEGQEVLGRLAPIDTTKRNAPISDGWKR